YIRYQIISELLAELIEGIAVAVHAVVYRGASVRCNNDKGLYLAVGNQIIHDLLDIRVVTCHSPLPDISADSMQKIHYIILLGLIIARRKIHIRLLFGVLHIAVVRLGRIGYQFDCSPVVNRLTVLGWNLVNNGYL